jgi:hypothetical protein
MPVTPRTEAACRRPESKFQRCRFPAAPKPHPACRQTRLGRPRGCIHRCTRHSFLWHSQRRRCTQRSLRLRSTCLLGKVDMWRLTWPPRWWSRCLWRTQCRWCQTGRCQLGRARQRPPSQPGKRPWPWRTQNGEGCRQVTDLFVDCPRSRVEPWESRGRGRGSRRRWPSEAPSPKGCSGPARGACSLTWSCKLYPRACQRMTVTTHNVAQDNQA